jgi:hypothetical protein
MDNVQDLVSETIEGVKWIEDPQTNLNGVLDSSWSCSFPFFFCKSSTQRTLFWDV